MPKLRYRWSHIHQWWWRVSYVGDTSNWLVEQQQFEIALVISSTKSAAEAAKYLSGYCDNLELSNAP